MRIGIDCRALENSRGGIAQYTFSLVKNILSSDKENQYFLFFNAKYSEKYKKYFEQENCSIIYLSKRKLFSRIPFLFNHIWISFLLYYYRLNIFHSLAGIIPLLYFGRSIITIHDLAIFYHQEWFLKGQWFAKKVLVPFSLKKSRMIIAVSKNTKKEILDLFRISEAKIRVIYEAGIDRFLLKNESESDLNVDLSENYILTIGTLEPRKNLINLLEAFATYALKYSRNKEKLVIIGAKGWGCDQIKQKIKFLGLRDKVILTGFIEEERKIQILKTAKVFVFVSLYEGFGIPVLEAMNLGVPVLCSQEAGGLSEVTNGAAYLVDPLNIEAIAKGLSKVLNNFNLRKRLKEGGLKWSNNFSWEKCAKETISIYRFTYQV